MKFKRLTDFKAVDVKDYVTNYIIDNDDIEVYVGCDSQKIGRDLKFATVIVLYQKGKGGHVLFKAERVAPIREIKMRMLAEVQKSIEVATYLREEVGVTVHQIDIDINDDPKFKSNSALTEAVGWVIGMGFHPKWKPHELFAVPTANMLCR